MITILIIVSTAIVSIICFQRDDLFMKLDFSPYNILRRKEWYRFITHGFVHADWVHLIVNMLVFFSFGSNVEKIFKILEDKNILFSAELAYIILYFGGMIIAAVSTLIKHKDNPNYASVGASGAVSAVLFTSIFFSPLGKILFFGVIPMPGFVFGILYLAYATYMGRSGRGNINHDAHFWGAVFGFVFPIIIDPHLFSAFIQQF
ncbi:MAG TPA: rhomboid family intramembrane serine protease [Bacteroidales bacterium]|nr:rhomboid family intramembrane serine protease [Bacteroidales bacterium]